MCIQNSVCMNKIKLNNITSGYISEKKTFLLLIKKKIACCFTEQFARCYRENNINA